MTKEYWFKNRMIIIVVVELLLFCSVLFMYLLKRSGGTEALDTGIKTSDFSSEYALFNDGWHFEADMVDIQEDQEEIEVLYGPDIVIERGDYTLVAIYDCQYSQKLKPCSVDDDKASVQADYIKLDDYLNEISYSFRIKDRVDHFQIKAFYDGSGFFTIKDIHLYKNLNPYKRAILIMLFVFIAGDLIVWNWAFIVQHKTEVISLSIIIMVLSLPLVVNGIGCPLDDTDFHLMRIEGLYHELLLGHIPSRLQSAWASGNGYPVSVFYGDILLYFPAFLRLSGFSIPFSYGAYVAFVNALTVLLSFFSFRIIVNDRVIPLVMTFAYAATNYRINTIYVRGAMGEYTAVAFLPLIAAAIYMVYSSGDKSHLPDIKAAIILAIAMSGIITSHILSIEMTLVVLMLFCIINIKKTIRIRTILTYVTAAALSVGLSLFFTIPFIDYYRNADVIVTKKSEEIALIQDEGVALFQLFAFFQNPYKIINRGVAPGLLLMLVFIIAVVFCLKTEASKKIIMMTVFSGILIYMSTDMFPWDWITSNLTIGHILAAIQFPIRYLAYSCVTLTVLLGFILERIKEYKSGDKHIVFSGTVISAVSICFLNVFVFYAFFGQEAVIWYPIDSIDIPNNPIMDKQYMRFDEKGEPVSYIRSGVASENAEVAVISKQGWTLDMNVETGDVPGTVKTPFTNYEGYQAFDATGNHFGIFNDEYCKVAFVVPENYEGVVRVTFVEPWYWRVSEIISLIAWIGLISVGFFRCLRRRK